MRKLSRLELKQLLHKKPSESSDVKKLLDHILLLEQEFRTFAMFVSNERKTRERVEQQLEYHRGLWCSCGTCDACKKDEVEFKELKALYPEDFTNG